MSKPDADRSGGICFGARGATTESIGLGQVVPPTRPADFDDVAGEITILTGERRKLGLLRNAAPVGGKSRAEHIGDVHKGFFFADRTRFRSGFTQVLGGSDQFRVGVANVDTRKPPALVFSNQMTTNQTKVNRSRPTLLDAANGVSSKRHSGEATATRALPFASLPSSTRAFVPWRSCCVAPPTKRPSDEPSESRQEKWSLTRFRKPSRTSATAWSLP
jgi:hypothetical protein